VLSPIKTELRIRCGFRTAFGMIALIIRNLMPIKIMMARA
jgi:hypothetical protein